MQFFFAELLYFFHLVFHFANNLLFKSIQRTIIIKYHYFLKKKLKDIYIFYHNNENLLINKLIKEAKFSYKLLFYIS